MTEIQIPYLPTAQFFKILCRLGVNEQDVIGDSDSDPQIRTIGGTVSISAMVPRFRYTEADGRKRVVYTKTETYNIQTSTGELFDADGNIGVNLLNTNSPQMDPQGWTYKATIRPNGGAPFDALIPSNPEGGVYDLGDGLVFTPSTGITSLETRVKALEDAAGNTSGLLENFDEAVQDIVGAMVTDAGGTYYDTTGEIALPSGGASGSVADASTTTKGVVELATIAEATAGTDTARAVTPAGLKAVADTKAPKLGADNNYVTNTEKVKLANLSGTNTGDQDLSAYATTASLATQAINARTGTAYTLVESDASKLVTLTNSGAITLTVPAGVFTTGQRVDCLVAGVGMVTVTAGSGLTLNGTPTLVSRAQWSAFTILFTSATAAVVVGDLASA